MQTPPFDLRHPDGRCRDISQKREAKRRWSVCIAANERLLMQSHQLAPKPRSLIRFENRPTMSGIVSVPRALPQCGLQGCREERGVGETRIDRNHATDQCRRDQCKSVPSKHGCSPNSPSPRRRSDSSIRTSAREPSQVSGRKADQPPLTRSGLSHDRGCYAPVAAGHGHPKTDGGRCLGSTDLGRRLRHHRPGDGFGDLDAVDGSRQDAAGIAGAFAGREEAAHVQALEVGAAGHSDRG